MAYILGTAGHVDHGKTALIKRLTGIETSHLPEEKRRGMTIELGFASLQDIELGTVGIVDVPGHERFIRNMVAGTWGLDAALLVVAADDGWMQMTTDHLRVLKSMQVNSIIAVITKSDLADDETLEILKEEIYINSLKLLDRELPVVTVSALTGDGIENLKEKITCLLKESKKIEPDKSFLYVDRVFTLKGIGTTVTGTLRGSKILIGDNLKLYPSGVDCRIKSIQSHHQDLQEIDAGSRTALNLKVPEKIEVKRGMLLAKKESSPILVGSELLIRINEFFYEDGEVNTFKNHTELEIALGSAHAIGKLHLNNFDNSLGRLSLKEPVSSAWNQNAVLIRHGGSSIIASCRVLASFTSYNRSTFKEAFKIYTNRELPSWKSYLFYADGAIEKSKASLDELTQDKKDVTACGEWFVLTEKLKLWETKILELAKKSQAGFTAEEVDINIKQKAKTAILKYLCEIKKLEQNANLYNISGQTGACLSKNAKRLLDMALKADTAGVDIDKVNIPQVRKEARDLVKLNELVLLENSLYFHKKVYENTVVKIMQDRKTGDLISISDARQATSLSRKYIIPILNCMEKSGKVKREGNDRIVL
ncbi:MAG: selenocysteine-specific translation elongation factor [Treponema sp.]|nr:MAG: selenocysteine-specific translation elongation factor [Treponema sp.]